ncbi:hypothetical protein [Chitinophaga eiseniae]|uniref:Uncharacterized protein n=1 Tax=Chitinophaga eiseniae TaxID=634771 RepID=A0A847SFH1_9BACT|nr:hypothetical protein [Chitinophaga eiseniae]NLR80531.1 hypothetical protein [Chitinophaga eiseniae]
MIALVVRWASLVAIAAGTAGMLFCFPFLFSAHHEDLIGAGFPFAGGAIIAGAGLTALSKIVEEGEQFMCSLVKWGALAAIGLGVAGMFFCLQFLFSAHMVDLIGAGFPFVGGAIIASAGLITLSNLAVKKISE